MSLTRTHFSAADFKTLNKLRIQEEASKLENFKKKMLHDADRMFSTDDRKSNLNTSFEKKLEQVEKI